MVIQSGKLELIMQIISYRSEQEVKFKSAMFDLDLDLELVVCNLS